MFKRQFLVEEVHESVELALFPIISVCLDVRDTEVIVESLLKEDDHSSGRGCGEVGLEKVFLV